MGVYLGRVREIVARVVIVARIGFVHSGARSEEVRKCKDVCGGTVRGAFQTAQTRDV